MTVATRLISTTKVVAAVGASAMLTASAFAGTLPGRQYFGISAGAGAVFHAQPCPDIPCNNGDTCSCVTGAGSATFHALSPNKDYPATFTIEVSADDSTAINNGSGGKCFGTTGVLTLTLKPGTITLPFSSLGCRIGQPMNNTGTWGISAPIYISSGTGQYVKGKGTGTIGATIDPTAGTILMDVSGYANSLK